MYFWDITLEQPKNNMIQPADGGPTPQSSLTALELEKSVKKGGAEEESCTAGDPLL